MMVMSLQKSSCSRNLSVGVQSAEPDRPHPPFSDTCPTWGWTTPVGSWGSSGHCVETGLLGCTRGGRAPSSGEGRAGRGAGLCRAGCDPRACSPSAPPSGQPLSGLRPSWEGWGRALARGARVSRTKTTQGVSTWTGRESCASAGGSNPRLPGLWEGKRSAPRTPGKGSPLRPGGRQGWGRAFVWPGRARAGLSAEPLGGLGAAPSPYLSNVRGLGTSRGVLSVLDLGAGKEGTRTADRSRAPLPSPLPFAQESEPEVSPAAPGRVGQGGVVQSKPLSPLFPSTHPAPGEGCFQPPPELQPLPACPRGPPKGPGGARPRGWGWRPWIRNLVWYLSLDTGWAYENCGYLALFDLQNCYITWLS